MRPICWLTSVHPRACGELAEGAAGEMAETGSSPRLRGTPEELQSDLELVRFIPAPAGNS